MIAATSLGSPRNGMPGRTGYVWHGKPELSEAVQHRLRPKRPRPITDPDAARFRVRDVPASCTCKWLWRSRHPKHWQRRSTATGCPWHTGRPA